MQRTVVGALRSLETGMEAIPARLQFSRGAEDHVVVLWRNVIVGFVPPTHRDELRRQLDDAVTAPLVADGHVRRHDGVWRVWAGPAWPVAEGPPQPPPDEIDPPSNAIFGFPLRS